MASALCIHNLYVHILTGPNVHELAIVHVYDNLDISAVRPTAVVYMHVVCL